MLVSAYSSSRRMLAVSEGQLPSFGHRVPCIHRDVHEDLVYLILSCHHNEPNNPVESGYTCNSEGGIFQSGQSVCEKRFALPLGY